MTRDKAIEICKKIRHYLTFESPIWDIDDPDKVHEALTIAIVNMEVIPKLEAQLSEEGMTFGKWIPCSERLPEKYRKVIVSDDYLVYTAVRTDIDGYTGQIKDYTHWEDGECKNYVNPDAWMPLPEPYMEEQPERLT